MYMTIAYINQYVMHDGHCQLNY